VAASTTNTAIAPDFRTIILRTIVILAGFTSTCFVSVRRRGGKSNCAARERGPETSGAITQATSQGAKDNLPPVRPQPRQAFHQGVPQGGMRGSLGQTPLVVAASAGRGRRLVARAPVVTAGAASRVGECRWRN
jgi:hypothetical protein